MRQGLGWWIPAAVLCAFPLTAQMVWQRATPAHVPPARYDHALASDVPRATIVMFGGRGFYGARWIAWTPIPQPSHRDSDALAWDVTHGGVLLFGGWWFHAAVLYADTWHWLPTTRGGVVVRGDGCAGQSGVPQLVTEGAPIVGDTHFAMRVTNGAPGHAAVVVVSATGTPTPLPGGRTLFVAPPWIEFAGTLDVTGALAVPVPIPLDTGLSAADAFAQAFVADPAGALLGLAALTPGLVVTIGD